MHVKHVLQAFSSDPSLQSGLSSQKRALSIHSPLPHESLPSGQMGSSVFSLGKALRGPESLMELFLFPFSLVIKMVENVTVKFVAVGDFGLPVARLSLNIETQTGRATDSC